MKFKWHKGAPERLKGAEFDVRIEQGQLKIDVKAVVDSPLTDIEQKAIDDFCDFIAREVGVKEGTRQKSVGKPIKGSMEL